MRSPCSALLHCGCGRDNDPWRRFCGGCGASLGASCKGCGFINRTSERFCGGCGGPCRIVRSQSPEQRTIPIDLTELLVEKPIRE